MIKRVIEFIINWYWVGTLEKIYWSLFITEGVWLINWIAGREVVSENTIEAIASQAFYYLGWVAIVNINLFIISAFIKWVVGRFMTIPDRIILKQQAPDKPRQHTD